MSTRDSHFTDVFHYDTHVLGNVGSVSESEWEVLLPSDNCSKLISGWDLGSRNHSAHIIEVLNIDGVQYFHILDECVIFDSVSPLRDFVEFFVTRWDFWTGYITANCHKNPIQNQHYSDDSAFNQFRATLGNFDHNTVATESEGKIMLVAAPKGKNSVAKRLDIVRRLLVENRLFISASCVNTVQMFRALKRGKNKAELIERTQHCHVFDSLSYALSAECANELMSEWSPNIAPKPEIVSVRL